jgi:hydroxypyruvate reductase
MRDREPLLLQMFQAAVRAADPAACVPRALPGRPKGRTVVIGAGKASAAMARALEGAWSGPLEGLVVTRYGHGVPCDRIRIVEAAHPVPDAAGLAAAQGILEAVRGLTADDLVIALISGGGSSLLTLPAPGLTLADKQAVNRALLQSGANIREMNCVRKHLSAIKGGRLAAAAAPAQVVTLAISDVPGDDPSVVASGPTVPDASTREEALAILKRYRIENEAALRRLGDPASETPKAGDPAFARAETHLIATPMMSLRAAAEVARGAGYRTLLLGDAIEGEAREVGIVHAGIVRSILTQGEPAAAPLVLLSGGETTVTVKSEGKGGRNSEFLLGLALSLQGLDGVAALACDTDGIDGSEQNAGAVLFPDTLERIRARGLDPRALLDRNQAFTAFEAAEDLVVTGPTLTNVNDFRAILIEGRA